METGGSDVAASTCDIETPSQTIAMKSESLSPPSPPSPLRCIHRVPDRFRCESEKDYTPRVISIGPYHHKNQALKRMEVHKGWYLNCFMERSQSQSSHSQNDYIDKIRDQEEKLWKCYTETIDLTRDEFVTMVLVDAIFLLEFLLRYADGGDLQDENDCIFRTPCMLPDVATDLLMLENQLPLFILEDLLSLYNGESRGRAKRLAINFLINQASWSFGVRLDNYGYSSQVEGHHFVDLLRNLLMAPLSAEEKLMGETPSTIAPSVETLYLSGGEIHGETSSIPNLFAIRFDDYRRSAGILKIPKLRIAYPTELILRNLIAFEQCSMFKDPIICHYVILMAMLVDSPKDVELLVERKIVENDLLCGDDELSRMIHRLSRGIVYDPDTFYYGALCGKMDKFCSRLPKWMRNLRRIIFNSPWAGFSVFLFIFTVIQTISSVYPR